MVAIREAKETDAQAISDIDDFGEQLNSYRGIDRIRDDPDEGLSYYMDFIQSEGKWCYVAEEKGIIGFVLFNINHREDLYEISKTGYIDLLYVKEDARGKGVCRALLKKAEKILKDNGISSIDLAVHEDNPAKAAWESLGFIPYRMHMFKDI